MKKLNTFVHVVERDEDGTIGRSATFGPTDRVPDWAVESITNPDVWDDDEDQSEQTAGDSTPVKEPPRGGPGSSAEAWREFAQGQDVDVPDGASARDIQAIWDERTV